jgi:hypothetical protein
MTVDFSVPIFIGPGSVIANIKAIERLELYGGEKKKSMKVSSLIFNLCMGCPKNNCFRVFTCKTWKNSILYAVGEKYIWFSHNGDIVDGNKKGKIYTLEQSLEYCQRKRDPWVELKNPEEIKTFLERSGYGY